MATRELTREEIIEQGTQARVDRAANLLDDCFEIPGTKIRFGWDAVIGLVPGAGDWVTSAFSFYIILEALAAGASPWVALRMLANVGVEAIFGIVPLVGDLFDVGWKANRRNARLLEAHFADFRSSKRTSRGYILGFGFLFLCLGVSLLAAFALALVFMVNTALHAMGVN